MAGLFDIGSSGIQAYRKALSVTGQNIANMNTEGYRRREASMEEISGTQGGILSISDQVGLGVRVSDISRAFDGFIVGRARDSQSDFSKADTYKDALKTLETVILPEDYDLTFSINQFFDGISSIAQAPGDLAGRVVALEQGKSFASAFSSLSGSLEGLKTSIEGEIKNVVSSLNIEMQGLADIQAKLISAGGSGNAANSLLDQRDKSIASISEFVGLSADYQLRGDATLSLGSTGNGPLLVQSKRAGVISVAFEEGKVTVYLGTGASITATKQATSGVLAGLISAYDTISQTERDLDGLATQVVGDLNTVHNSGLTLDGKRGGDMFTLGAITAEQSATNLGAITTSVTSIDKSVGDVQLSVTYDKAKNIWMATNPDGTFAVSGQNSITYQGITLSINGTAADGDEIILSQSTGKAANMQFLLTRAEEFAAAGAILSTEGVQNTGSALISVNAFSSPLPTGLTDLTQLLQNDSGSAAATRFRKDGVVGVIPAGVKNIDLFSLKTQDSISFNLSDTQQDNLTNLKLTLDGVEYEFDTAAHTERRLADDRMDLSDLADMLNNGSIASANQKSFADLGLFAAGESGLLAVASDSAALTAGFVNAGNLIAGGVSQGNATASQVQVFTREGRQIAGVPLSASEVINYLTPANGFLKNAEYSADYLNGMAEGGFQGSDVQRTSPTGSQTIQFTAGGFTHPVWSGDSIPVSVPTAAQTITLAVGNETGLQIDIPQGVMAGYIAEQINDVRADLGVEAQAKTRVLMSDVPNGVISFTLTSENSSPISFVGSVNNSDLRDLAVLVNAKASETGVTASVSSDFTQLVLTNAAGSDIVFGDVTTQGDGIDLMPVGSIGQPRTASPVSLGATNSSTKFARFGGEITLKVPTNFSLTTDFGQKNSVADSFLDGLISRNVDPAGSWMELNFKAIEGIDGNEARPDGSLASAAAAKFSISLETDGSDDRITGEVHSSQLSDLGSQSIAAALVKQVRSVAPVPILKGTAVSQLPEDDDSITLSLGRQDYILRMTNGEVVVEGPEDGRLSASFNDSLELVVSAQDGIETGEILHVSPDASTTSRALFGLAVGEQTQELIGRSFAESIITSSPLTLAISTGGSTYSVQVVLNANNAVEVTSSPSLPANTEITVGTPENGFYQINIVRSGTDDANDLRILAGSDAIALGLAVTPNQLLVDESGLRVLSIDKSSIGIEATAESLVSEHISLRDLPNEELIVILTGDGARRLSMQFDQEPIVPTNGLTRPLDILVTDGASRRIDIIDHETGHSLASRYLDETGRFNVAGVDLQINGTVNDGDTFSVTGNVNGQGDGRNISQLLALQSMDTKTGRGGFSEKFSTIILDVGAKVRASSIAASSSEAVRDAAMEIESEFSGVNLDTEAARLLEQQQAYQALARVLSTAKELLETLMQSI